MVFRAVLCGVPSTAPHYIDCPSREPTADIRQLDTEGAALADGELFIFQWINMRTDRWTGMRLQIVSGRCKLHHQCGPNTTQRWQNDCQHRCGLCNFFSIQPCGRQFAIDEWLIDDPRLSISELMNIDGPATWRS